jgi:hypothetical protein
MAQFSFESRVLHWRGPSPYFFAPIPAGPSAEIRRLAKFVTYGWGVIPVQASVGGVAFTTSLFPKDGAYLLPLKDAVRRKAGVTAGEVVAVELTIAVEERPA